MPNPIYTLRYAVVPASAYDDPAAEITVTTVPQGAVMGVARDKSKAEGIPYSVVKLVEVAYVAEDADLPEPHVVP